MAIDKIHSTDQPTPKVNAPATTSPTVTDDLNAQAAQATKPKRTPGLRILDNLLYTVLNNTAVFAVSVAATYITQNKNKTYDGFAGWLQKRGDRFVNYAMKKGMSKNSAENASMVAFSFIDGSIMAPVVKIAEDYREPLAKKIDEALGTVPNDLSVYDAEPKQSWGSMLMGRITTLGAVLPIAVTLDKIGKHSTGEWGIKGTHGKDPQFKDLNTSLFRDPGLKLGEQLQKKFPSLNTRFNNTPLLFRTTLFEAFYTSVCTAGLYVGSRFFARKEKARSEHALQRSQHSMADDALNVSESPYTSAEQTKNQHALTVEQDSSNAVPLTRVDHISHANRIEQLPAHAVGA